MKKLVLIIFVLLQGFLSFAQDVVINENLSDTTRKKKGPNLKVYRQNWIQFSFFTPYENNPLQKFPASYHIGFGYRAKYKLNNTFSWGWGLAFHFNHHRLNYFLNHPVYGLQSIRKEKFLQRQFAGELFFRTNFGKRGNILGKFLDLGASGGVNVWNTFRYVIDEKDLFGNNQGETTINIRKSGKAIPYYYGVIARLGWYRWVVSGEMRLSSFFYSGENLPDLSPVRVGIQWGL